MIRYNDDIIADARHDLAVLSIRIDHRKAQPIESDDPVLARMIGRKVEIERWLSAIDSQQVDVVTAGSHWHWRRACREMNGHGKRRKV